MVRRIYVEKREGADNNSGKVKTDVREVLGIELSAVRTFLRYDFEGVDDKVAEYAKVTIFSEPTVDYTYDNLDFLKGTDARLICVQYLDGQFDQRADSAAQCLQLLSSGAKPTVRCATVYAIYGAGEEQLTRIKGLLINPVDSTEGSFDLPNTLARNTDTGAVRRIELDGFIRLSEAELKKYFDSVGFAMSFEDLRFVQSYFASEGRNPTETELKVIDTYWSDHCRHTTFLTELTDVETDESDRNGVGEAWNFYRSKFDEQYAGRSDKYPCLMDIATLAAKVLKREGYLAALDQSEEINACSVNVRVDNDGVSEDWLVMFKNETHNHPTEIEPFGGAATCLGGAIRDPLSGRAYVYQAMRITGAATPDAATPEGKLPQKVLIKKALAGFSSYGNQIGLATGTVFEIYHDDYQAKRLETGYVIGGAPKKNVIRYTPKSGDVVLLVGGDTGRDGCGGATGSSKAHNEKSVELCGAEVQKGNAPEERKLQRLFRNERAAQLILRCNDFGAGGVSVAIGELAEGLDIRLEAVSKKYDGLTATELAISESQERMAVVVESANVQEFIRLAKEENLLATEVATVTETGRLRMYYGELSIVDLSREFLDTNGVRQSQRVKLNSDWKGYRILGDSDGKSGEAHALYLDRAYGKALLKLLSRYENCSQKGAGEHFDSTIGAASVLMPFGGRCQLTPSMIMASKPPVSGTTDTVTCSSYGVDTLTLVDSPYVGAMNSIVTAVSKLIASGVARNDIYLSLQEYFRKLGKEPSRWGIPTSAMLGAFEAQCGLKIAAIGGKDSMSGSFGSRDVPNTLIAFAMGVTKADKLKHNAFGSFGYVYRFDIPVVSSKLPKPNFPELLNMYDEVKKLLDSDRVLYSAVEDGGTAVTLAKSCMGNKVGLELVTMSQEFFEHRQGAIILVTDGACEDISYGSYLGKLNASGKLTYQDNEVSIEDCIEAYVKPLETVFPTVSGVTGSAENASYSTTERYHSINVLPNGARPRIIIPAFPGTNCEYDMARAFSRGNRAEARIFVFKNKTASDIEQSIAELTRLINQSNVIAFPGGFSAGDEPDGSGKFIATAFRNPRLAGAVEELLYKRDGLALGICNGFQALIKLGLLPFGTIVPQTAESATLTYNDIGRHVSTIADIRIASNASPWLSRFKVGEVYRVPVSHGEGKFICTQAVMSRLISGGQIATQYVDESGNATMLSPYNPNGSLGAVEGIISPDGRVFGKMGHSERYQNGLYQNLQGNFDMDIFASGIAYFD